MPRGMAEVQPLPGTPHTAHRTPHISITAKIRYKNNSCQRMIYMRRQLFSG
jgi:hypothetical protein